MMCNRLEEAHPMADSSLLTLACRFIPYDQWLTTHIDPSWKVKQVKLWILSKCLGIPFESTVADSNVTADGGGGVYIKTTPPAPRYRPVSPITFAPDPRRRPISPILFAKGNIKNSSKTGARKPPNSGGSVDTHGDTISGDSPDGTGENGDEPAQFEDDAGMGEGYEEDDEWDTADEGDDFDDLDVLGYVGSGPTAPTMPEPSSNANTRPVVATPPEWAKYNTNPATYTLLRFSTGQLLEDEFSMSWYDLAPFEMLELHAHLPVQTPPSSFAVTAARTDPSSAPIVGASGVHHQSTVGDHGKHRRNTSLYSLSTSAPTQSYSTHGIQNTTRPAFTQPQIYLPPLDRSSLATYVLPYWEGYVRALRVVLREPETPFANFANGYGYGYGGPAMGGIGPGGMGSGLVQPGGFDFGPGFDRRHGHLAVPGRRTALEWRMRWVVIRKGVLSLCKDRDDPHPTHILPLCSLTAIRGAEHLASSTSLMRREPPVRSAPPASKSKSTKQKTKKKHKQKENEKDDTSVHPTASMAGSRYSTTAAPSFVSAPTSYHMRSPPDSETDIESASERAGGASSAGERRRRNRGSVPGMGFGFADWPGGADPAHAEKDETGGRVPTRSQAQALERLLGDEATDDLRIVCIKFRSADRLRGLEDEPICVPNPPPPPANGTLPPVPRPGNKRYSSTLGYGFGLGGDGTGVGGGVGADGMGVTSFVSAGPGKGKQREGGATRATGGPLGGEGVAHPTQSVLSGGTGDRRTEKGKGKGKGLLPWERDGEKLKKSKGKEQEKGKGKERDWISAFGGKPKDKDREREKERSGLTLGGMGMGMGLSLGLVASAQDAKQQHAEKERLREQRLMLIAEKQFQQLPPMADDVNADALSSSSHDEGSIVFAPISTIVSSDEEEGGDMEEEGEDEGEYEIPPPAEEEDDGTLDDHGAAHNGETDAEGEEDGDQDIRSDSPLSCFAPAPSMSSHAHPQSELLDMGSDLDSEVWSSPVFAHTDDSADGAGSDVDGRQGADDGKERERGDGYRYGYRYGYQYESAEAARWGTQAGTHEQESLHEEEDRLDKEKANMERRRAKEQAKKMAEVREKEKEKAEWIVLDMGTDLAFSSFLRIIHRHLAPPMSSSFISAGPDFSKPTPASTPTPTPTPTPFSSPISAHPKAGDGQSFHWTSPSSPTILEHRHPEIASSSSTLLSSQESTLAQSTELLSPESASSKSGRFRYEAPHHPTALAALSSHPPAATAKSFGVLPYPEWRMEVAERAQRAGMGDVGRAMRWVLWQCGTQLDLDLTEVRNRNAEGQEATAEIRRKRRETMTLKNRRRSSASHASTINGQNGTRSRPTTVYDSDVSEDTGKMIAITDSEEESSEAEWQGWMADLHRQHKAQAHQKREEEAAAAKPSPYESDEGVLEPPRNPEEDRKQIRDRRWAMEPSAIVTTKPMRIMASTSVKTTPAATLYSPSSNESLARRQRARALSFSPVDRSASPSTTNHSPNHSHHGHTQSQSASPWTQHHIRKHALPPGSNLAHSTSMYATGLRSASNIAEQALRRPSMPTLTADQPGAMVSSQVSVAKSPTASNFSFMPPTSGPAHSPPFSPGFSSAFPVDEGMLNDASTSARIVDSGPATMPRRASSAGFISIGGIGGSLGRSSSVVTRGTGLLKKDTGKEAERAREKDRDRGKRAREKDEKAKEKEDKAKGKERTKDVEKEPKEARKLQRPKLSLTTSAAHQQPPTQTMTPQVRNPTRTDMGRSILRRVKSSSSLVSRNGPEESVLVPSDARTDIPYSIKKKRTVIAHGVEKFVRGLDSAVGFVDGR